MSTKMNPNMPAFPTPDTCGYENGLSKREMIAAMAMQGILSNATMQDRIDAAAESTGQRPSLLNASLAVATADNLLAELERTKK